MAQYKVPQDVEADDKLIGPFSFRQFVYLIIVVLCIMLAWGLSQLFIPLAVIPLPIIIFFGALALPLRKDQPMEIYMAAMVSFYLKPHRRLWDPDGIESLIEITVPKIVEVQRTKDLSESEAKRRFTYLAEIVDSGGWAVRGPGIEAPDTALNSDVYYEAQQARDVLDIDDSAAKSIDQKLSQSSAKKHQEMVDIMKKPNDTTPQQMIAAPPIINPYADLTKDIKFNPYPDIQQAVIQPIGEKNQAPEPPINTSEKVVPAGIINLASNADLSIETIAREANRIQKKQDHDDEVVISLR